MKRKIIVTTAALLITFNITVYASSTDIFKNQIGDNQEAIENLEGEKQELSNDKKLILGELKEIMEKSATVTKEADDLSAVIRQKESEIIARETSINEANSKITLLEAEIEKSKTEIEKNEIELAEKNAILDARVRAAYKNDSVGSFIFTLMESESILDFTDRLSMINRIVDLDKEIIHQIEVIKEELDTKKAALEVNKIDLVDTKEAIEKEKAVLVEEKGILDTEKQTLTTKLSELKSLENEKAGILNTLTTEEKEIASEIGDIVEENDELQNEITALIKAEAKIAEAKKAEAKLAEAKLAEAKLAEMKLAEAKKAEASKVEANKVEANKVEANRVEANKAEAIKNAPADESSSTSQSVSNSGYINPVAGRISSNYGYRIHPILGYKKLHTGIDFAASSGTPIKAAKSGKVIRASFNSSYGNHVIVDHGNGVTTLYAHMSAMNTSYGAGVSQGQVIGYVGSTGMSTGPHLHLEFRVNGNLVNPASYLGL